MEKRLLTREDISGYRQAEARAYARLRYRLLAVDVAWGVVFGLLFVLTGMSWWLKGLIQGWTTEPFLLVAGYFVLFAVAYGLPTLPLQYYGGFLLAHRYGLSRQRFRGWLADEMKAGVLGLGLGLVLVEVVYWLFGVVPGVWWLIAAVVVLLFTVGVAELAPVMIVPLFYKLTPLTDEELVRRLTTLAERAKASVRGVFTINLSSKTRAANAMLMGLGRTRRIVLGDTLYGEYSGEEIETILAHELGHHVGRDVWWGLLVESTMTVLGLYVADVGLRWGVRALGFGGLDDVAALPLWLLILGAFMAVTTPVSNAFSRWREWLADEYALRMTGKPAAFVSVMVRLANQNLAEVDPEPWVEYLLYSHPAIGKRILHGEGFEASRRSGGEGDYCLAGG
jgi:STE24 endopeptidase